MNLDSSEILGIGTPILDLLVPVNPAFLKKIGGAKGGSQSVDYETFTRFLKESGRKPTYAMGGSAANTIKGLAHLGRRCAFAGKIGNDEAGKQFLEEMTTLHIASHLIQTDTPTAQVACFLSPDHERTMRSFIPAGNELRPEDLHAALFDGISLLHLEGYLLDFGELIQRAMECAKKAGAKVSFNLGSFEITSRYKKTILYLLSKYVDVLFANTVETKVLTNLDPEKGCSFLKDLCETAVVTMGDKGCWAARGKEEIHQPAYSVKVVDTTGAGDLFASGFLHGYLANKPLQESARYGTLIASEVIQNYGVTIPPERWKSIQNSG